MSSCIVVLTVVYEVAMVTECDADKLHHIFKHSKERSIDIHSRCHPLYLY